MAREAEIVRELRELIVRAAPDPDQAEAARGCAVDAPLDRMMPFSSVIVLGVVVAVEDHFGVVVTREALRRAALGGVTLGKLARMIEELEG